MESDKSAYFTLKYGFLLFGVIWMMGPILMYLFPENSTYNGEPGPPDIWTSVGTMLFGSLFVLPFLWLRKRFVFAKVGNQIIQLKHQGKVIENNWLDVESVKMIPFVYPPVYKIRYKGQESYFLFTTGRFSLNIAGFTFDWSAMGTLIKKKKKELGI
jgi:hypothetical protein